MRGDRHDMSDAEREILRPVLPRKHQGPRRVHDRRVMNGTFFVLRTGTPWRDLPERYGPYTTCFNRYNRWSGNGTRASIMERLQGVRAMTAGTTTARPARFDCAWWIRLRCAYTGVTPWVSRASRSAAGRPRRFSPALSVTRRWSATGPLTPTPYLN